MATSTKRLRQRPSGISRFQRRRARLLVCCGHRHDLHVLRHRETADRDPGSYCNCLRPDERAASNQTPVFHLPTSPLLGGLIDDVNSTLARLIEEQTSGFIPFPMKQHRRFYCTAAPSLSAPYVVPPSLASLTREKSSDHKRHPIHLPYSVLTGLESALAGIGETISWLNWWLSTVSGFREALHPSAQANFERILSSGIESPRLRWQPGKSKP